MSANDAQILAPRNHGHTQKYTESPGRLCPSRICSDSHYDKIVPATKSSDGRPAFVAVAVVSTKLAKTLKPDPSSPGMPSQLLLQLWKLARKSFIANEGQEPNTTCLRLRHCKSTSLCGVAVLHWRHSAYTACAATCLLQGKSSSAYYQSNMRQYAGVHAKSGPYPNVRTRLFS